MKRSSLPINRPYSAGIPDARKPDGHRITCCLLWFCVATLASLHEARADAGDITTNATPPPIFAWQMPPNPQEAAPNRSAGTAWLTLLPCGETEPFWIRDRRSAKNFAFAEVAATLGLPGWTDESFSKNADAPKGLDWSHAPESAAIAFSSLSLCGGLLLLRSRSPRAESIVLMASPAGAEPAR